jgi:spore germination protein GerM
MISGRTTTAVASEETVSVFFGVEGSADCTELQEFTRTVASSQDPIEGAFAALLGGPLESEEASSWFSSATANALRSVALAEGVLTVDLDDISSLISNASSSCGSAALLAQIEATAFQFSEVEEVIVQFEGDCEAFFNFLQMSCTTLVRS